MKTRTNSTSVEATLTPTSTLRALVALYSTLPTIMPPIFCSLLHLESFQPCAYASCDEYIVVTRRTENSGQLCTRHTEVLRASVEDMYYRWHKGMYEPGGLTPLSEEEIAALEKEARSRGERRRRRNATARVIG